MTLTAKQENFCLAYLETGNASEAYRRAYDAENMADTTITRKAKDLMDRGNIAARIAELRQPVIEKAKLSLEQHLEDLRRLRDKAESEGKYGPAIQAEVARGKAAGLYIERTELTGKDGSPIKVDQPTLTVVLAEGSAKPNGTFSPSY